MFQKIKPVPGPKSCRKTDSPLKENTIRPPTDPLTIPKDSHRMPDKNALPQPSHWERIRKLKEATDLRQVAAHLGLRPEGKRYFCPRCQTPDTTSPEQKPELVILDRVFLCDRCGTGGDVLTLIRIVRGGGLQGTIEYLEQLIQTQNTGAQTPPSSSPVESRWKPTGRTSPPPVPVPQEPEIEPAEPGLPGSAPQSPIPAEEIPEPAIASAGQPEFPPTPTDSSLLPTDSTPPQPSLFSDLFLEERGNVEPPEQQTAPTPPEETSGESRTSAIEEAEGERGEPAEPQPMPMPSPSEQRSAVYAAFLAACWPIESARFVVSWLEERGLSVETATRLGIRLCGASYADLMERLEKELGQEALIEAGLLTENPERTGYVPTFWPYFKHSVAFLVVPYLQEGKPVYLKALPPLDRKRGDELQLPPMISLRHPLPCLYNHDTLAEAQGQRILFCERETDVLAAESNGFAAVGIPGWAHFKPEWVHFFEGIEVFLVLEEDEVALEGTRRITRFFDEAGMPQPREIRLPAGCDLKDYLSA